MTKLLRLGINRRFTKKEAYETGLDQTLDKLCRFGYVALFRADEFYITTKGWGMICEADAHDHGDAASSDRV